jgi:hypothetical protein
MSIIKPVKPVIEERRRRSVEDTETKQDQELSKKEFRVVVGAGIGGLGFLFFVAWLLLPLSAKIIPFVVAGALPLFTLYAVIYQAVVYRRQWNVMQRSLRQTDRVIEKMREQMIEIRSQTKAIQDSVVESQKLVAHTEKGLKISERNTLLSQRAYVVVSKREAIETGFWITVENSGNTPALEVAMKTITQPGFMAPKVPDWGNAGDSITWIGVLGPKDTYCLWVPFMRSLTAEEQDSFNDPDGLFNWWCAGSIYYKDIFQPHPTDYRETIFSFYHDRKRHNIQAGSPSENKVVEEYAADEKD